MKRKESVVGGYLRKESINYDTYLHGKGKMYSIMGKQSKEVKIVGVSG